MINFYDHVPNIYVSTSRDFQYMSWLVNIVLNAVKHNVDDLYRLPAHSSDARFTELLAMTLGFKVKRNYDKKQLEALVASLPAILKYKGTEYAVELAGNALVTAADVEGECKCSIEDGYFEAVIPQNLVDIALFTDLLPYILPAGIPCKIIRKAILSKTNTTKLAYSDVLYAKIYASDEILNDKFSAGNSSEYGFGSMFIPNTTEPSFANFYQVPDNTVQAEPDNKNQITVFNTGLLANTVVPVIDFGQAVQPGDLVAQNAELGTVNTTSVELINPRAKVLDDGKSITLEYSAIDVDDKQIILD